MRSDTESQGRSRDTIGIRSRGLGSEWDNSINYQGRLTVLVAGSASAQASANYALNWSVVGGGGACVPPVCFLFRVLWCEF